MRTAEDTRNEWKKMDELIGRASRGDRRAEEMLVSRYDGLIRKTASEYRSESLLCSFEDLVQEASIGFVEGLRKFDYEKGRDFTEWVKWSMRTAIRKCLTEKSRLVALPKWRVEQLSKVSRAVDAIRSGDGEVSVASVDRMIGKGAMKKEHIKEALVYMNSCGVVSLDSTGVNGDEEGRTLDEMIGSDDDFTERVEALELIASFSSILEGMDARERTVVTGKLGIDSEKKTEKAIGDEIGLSARSVRTIYQKTMSDIRMKMAV